MKRHFTRCCLLALLSLAACEKAEPDELGLTYVNGVPYYHFTPNDRLWLQAKEGDQWTFENLRGYRRVYRINRVIETLKYEHRKTSMGIPSSSTLLFYNDFITVRFSRIDSVGRSGAELRFARDAAMLTNLNSGGFDEKRSQFYVEGEDYEFVGNTDLISDYYSCRGLKFPRGAALNGPFEQLTVHGHTYYEVVAFKGTARGADCPPVPATFMQELYYDRQAGLVRMVSLAGEVWERVL
ncbi:hypothetical protein GCM10027594_26010 [Hymenobacter agri]